MAGGEMGLLEQQFAANVELSSCTCISSLKVSGEQVWWLRRGFPHILSWLCHRYFHIYVKIGHIALFNFAIRNILIRIKGIEIVIDSIGLKSSLINRTINKILVLYISDIRVEIPDVLNRPSLKLTSETSTKTPVPSNLPRSNSLQSVLILSQLLAVQLVNVNLIVLRLVKESLVHVNFQEISYSEEKLYNIVLNVINATCKILHSVEHQTLQPCLGEIAFSKVLSISLDPKNLKLKEISLQIQPEITITENMINLLFSHTALSGKSTSTQQVATNNWATQMWKKCPPVVKGEMTSVKIKIGQMGQRTLECAVKSIRAETAKSAISSLRFCIEEMQLNSSGTKMIQLHQVALRVESEDDILKTALVFSSFHCDLLEDDIEYWRLQLPDSPKSVKTKSKTSNSVYNLLSMLRNKNLRSIVDIKDVRFSFQSKLTALPLHAGWTNNHISVEFLFPEDVISNIPVANILSQSILSSEVLLEVCWCNMGKVLSYQSKKTHNWNTFLYLGVSSHTHSIKMEGMMDNLQLEFSPTLEEFLIKILKYFKQNRNKHPQIEDESRIQKSEVINKQVTTRITLTNCNIFCGSDMKVCLMLRMDSNTLELQANKAFLAFEESKLTCFLPDKDFYPCVKSLDVRNDVIWTCQMLAVTYEKKSRCLNIQWNNHMLFAWSHWIHLSVWQVLQNIKQLNDDIQQTSSHPEIMTKQNSIDVSIRVQGSLNATLILSTKHKISFSATEIKVMVQGKSLNLQVVEDVLINFDGHDVIGLCATRVSSSEQITLDRATFDDLILTQNSVILVEFSCVNISFPYDYYFAEAFSEEGIGAVKFLKALHKKPKFDFEAETPLPPDILIKTKAFNVEVADDPFEVKLRDNFELLEDEYVENQKRGKILDAKVEELRQTHRLLPNSKVDVLYANLQKRNTDIYIQRSRQMYSAAPRRSSLATWHFAEVEILALADPSCHGKQRVVEHIQNIDNESPYPEEGIEYSTLWCRKMRTSCTFISFALRDYPRPVMTMTNFYAWGTLIGAEATAPPRAKRQMYIPLDEPWVATTVDRSLAVLKFYYDLSCEVDSFVTGYGPCWEPAFSYLTLAMELINKPSSDPSPPLPFWDKMRLLFHGRVTLLCQQMAMILHASLDPYNTTEEMDFTWSNLLIDWTNAKILLKGDLSVYVRTASKYDDCRFLHIPNFKLAYVGVIVLLFKFLIIILDNRFKLNWLCLADPNDHHSVVQCAPDKIPEYSINQEHDSYRAFRSLNLNMSVSMETKATQTQREDNIPSMLFYSSTLRWLECLKVLLARSSRPIRRGLIFRNCKRKKLQLGRHYKSIRLSVSIHEFDVRYWMSFAKQCGFQLNAGKLTLSSEHNLSIVAVDDGLKHRPQAEWSVAYLNCEFNDVKVRLQSAPEDLNLSFSMPKENYFLSLSKVSYGRDAVPRENELNDTPTHCLVIYDLKGAWTKENRDIIFNLFDSYVNSKLLRRSLSTDALKSFKVDNSSSTPMVEIIFCWSRTKGNSMAVGGGSTSASPIVWGGRALQSSPAVNMLQQLIAEADSKATVFSEDLSGNTAEQQLHAVTDCQTDDVLHKNWLVELINSQVMLKGSETLGYVIMSSAKTQILQRIHLPVWRDVSLVTKTTWVGSLEYMQYYATVDPGELSPTLDNIHWLSVDNIEEKESMVVTDIPDMVGSGQGVGGVVSDTVGAVGKPRFTSELMVDATSSVQLQRIVSRCGCQFFYASYGENIDPKNLEQMPLLFMYTPLEDADLWPKEEPVDSFTLTHHDLNCCTNSLQYAMLLDIINNLLLHVELKKKEANEKLQRMRFQLQLSNIEDQKTPILHLQNQVRSLLSKLRRLEREMYLVHRAADEDEPNLELVSDLERQKYRLLTDDLNFRFTNIQLNAQADELAMMISCFKEQQMSARRLSHSKPDAKVNARRWNEVCFKHAQWRLTENDGQLGIADITISNFLYSKQTKIDDSAEHLLELGFIKVNNLLPNQIYKDVLQPTSLQSNMPFDRQCLRIFCREKPPVGGIAIKEHLEVNVVPMTLRLTHQFTQTVKKFCFPGTEHTPEELESDNKNKKLSQQRSSRVISNKDQDDIAKMKERAEKNKMFLYIKIPEVPVCFSFKAEKEKNLIKDMHDFNLVIPTLEYHDVTWMWQDLLTATENDCYKALISQAIKHKLQIRATKATGIDDDVPHDEDKARLLLGTKLLGVKIQIKKEEHI
uniref:FMP27/BLTP2/Hobbit GFWDK motif-containing RBG unit domain-containing protein n=1 Tax=Strigamia maritima TaxID=126957 RepID=T1IJV3_STRMM